jgi:hypothetical protein
VPRPALGVSVNLHGDAALPEMHVDVYGAGGPERLRRVEVRSGEPLRIEGLDSCSYRVVLEVPPWRLPRNADLTGGDDAQITWDLAPLRIEGTIRVGSNPTRARVTFMDDENEWIETRTDEWFAEATWGTERFAAGWMPEEEARRLIDWCAAEYARNAASRSLEAPPAADLTPADVSDAANRERLRKVIAIASKVAAGRLKLSEGSLPRCQEFARSI